jgi:hypothetical protein
MNFSQQSDIFDPTVAAPVTIIGAGSVGSQIAINLARIGCTCVTVWDGDSVASHNIPMSAYRQRDLARPKVVALAEIVSEAMGVAVTVHQRMYAGEPLRGSVVACVDTMEARALIWKQVKNNALVDLFVDTRIAAEFISVFAIRTCHPKDVEYYEHYLYPSRRALLPQCGLHGIVYVSGTAANAACASLTEWWSSGKTNTHLKMLCGHFQVC